MRLPIWEPYSVQGCDKRTAITKQEAVYIRLLIVSLALSAFNISNVVPVSNKNYKDSKHIKHHTGCNTKSCYKRVGIIWAKKHAPKKDQIITPFDLCVANHESGTGTVATPANSRFNTIDRSYNAEGYEGAYNWVNSTWLAMGGGKYAEHAYDASPEDQTRIFNAHANAQDWPETVPACGG